MDCKRTHTQPALPARGREIQFRKHPAISAAAFRRSLSLITTG
jgi:hypothetical protein